MMAPLYKGLSVLVSEFDDANNPSRVKVWIHSLLNFEQMSTFVWEERNW